MLQEARSRLTENAALMSVLADEGGSAPRVGADLRVARERIGYTLEEVAVALRIRLSYLDALESGRIGDLPGSAYALGFLRIYAEALGLDGDEISHRFKIEADEINKKTALDFPEPRLRAGIPAGAMVLLGLVLAIGVYIGWYKLSSDGRLPTEAVGPVPARLAPLAQQVGAPIVTPGLNGAALSVAAPPLPMPSQTVPSVAFPSGAGPSLAASAPAASEPVAMAPSQAAAAMPLPPPEPPPVPAEAATATLSAVHLPVVAPPSSLGAVPVPVVAASALAGAGAGGPAGAGAGGRIVVRAKADVWIELRERNGQVIFNRVLKPGESYTVPHQPGLLFTTGNALATEFLVDGMPTPGLGGVKGVRRDLSLDADAIRDGRFAAQLAGGRNGTPRAVARHAVNLLGERRACFAALNI